MKCVICQYGETEPGTTTVALTRDETTIVICDVPALYARSVAKST